MESRNDRVRRVAVFLSLPLMCVLLAGCGGDEGGGDPTASGEGPGTAPAPETVAEAMAYRHPLAQAYYEEHPDFFRQLSPEELPRDLIWEDGMDQPDIGSPDALKHGAETIWIQDFPRTFRTVGPDASTSFRSWIHDDNTMHLVKKHPATCNYYPGLAKQWAIAPDFKTVYFRIHPEARYSDGVPVTADDFFFTVYFMRSPWLQAPWYENWYSEKYTHITKFDDRTFAVGLKDAKPDALRFFEEDLPATPRHFYGEFGEDFVERYAWSEPPTTGPYAIDMSEVRKGRSLVQNRVEDWWAKDLKFYRYRYNTDTRRFIVIRDVEKAREAFVRGEYDMLRIRLPQTWYEKLDVPAVRDGYIIKAQFYNQVPRPCYSLRMNKSKPLLDNQDIREGIQHALDWELVIREYFRGDYERMQTCAPGYGEFTHPDIKARLFDAQKSAEAFARAGFDRRGGDGIFVNEEGQRLSFTITSGYRRLEEVLTILQERARKAGVELKIELLDETSGWKKVQEKKHEICLTALNHSVELYPRFFDFYHSYNAMKEDGSLKPDTNNFTVTANPAWDEIIDRYEASTDLEEIKKLSHQLQEKVHLDAAFSPGWVRPFYQCAYWRWVKWPDEFNYRLSREHDELCVHWIDEAVKEETLQARKEGRKFPGTTLIFDQHQIKESDDR